MKAHRTPERVLLYWFLSCSLVDSSSLYSSSLLSVTSKVGNQAMLPCSWKSHLGETPSVCHVQWKSLIDTVFEQRGGLKWESTELMGRVEVPEVQLASGDCSLIINDVQMEDAGQYESFMVVDGARSKKTRVFIQTVKLLVVDHKLYQVKHPGEDLVLDLHTPHSMRVVFQGRNSSEWSSLWLRGDKDNKRLCKHPVKEELTVKSVNLSDHGTFKVLDENGLAISTVQLSVEERSTTLKFTEFGEIPTGDAARSSSSALLFLSFLLLSFQILHLL